jgi:hypothetical protein
MFGHDAHSIGVPTNENIHQFIAVFYANFRQSDADPGTSKTSGSSSNPSNREEDGLRFGISFRLPLSMGGHGWHYLDAWKQRIIIPLIAIQLSFLSILLIGKSSAVSPLSYNQCYHRYTLSHNSN